MIMIARRFEAEKKLKWGIKGISSQSVVMGIMILVTTIKKFDVHCVILSTVISDKSEL